MASLLSVNAIFPICGLKLYFSLTTMPMSKWKIVQLKGERKP